MPQPILLSLTVRGDTLPHAALSAPLQWFIGEDVKLALELLDANGVPVDVADWKYAMDVRTRDNALSPILFYGAAIVGVYSAVRALNGAERTCGLV